tara:strand:+ start:177 stop:821 length:645 start_codon:yes stop_codon:yes gene_type:complete
MQKSYEVVVKGIAPLMLSNVQYSDPLGEAAKQKKHFTDKKGKSKTDDVHRAVRTLDWLYSGYWKKEGTCIVDHEDNTVAFDGYEDPYLPGCNFQRSLRDAATNWKLGKKSKEAIIVHNNPSIKYDGPKDAVEMFNSRSPKLQHAAPTSRGIWVNRICIPAGWECTYELFLNTELLEVCDLKKICHMAGKSSGLGTWRPAFGRYEVSSIKETELV